MSKAISLQVFQNNNNNSNKNNNSNNNNKKNSRYLCVNEFELNHVSYIGESNNIPLDNMINNLCEYGVECNVQPNNLSDNSVGLGGDTASIVKMGITIDGGANQVRIADCTLRFMASFL